MSDLKTLSRKFESPCCNPFCIEGNVVWLKLTQGKETCIDLKNWKRVRGLPWCAVQKKGNWYVQSRTITPFSGRWKTTYLHQLILSCPLVDHKDRNGLNNLEKNLRPATKQENSFNQRIRCDNTSGFRGVVRQNKTGKFEAHIRLSGKRKHLGTFTTPEEAARARDISAKVLFGQFASLNFV